MQQIEPTVPVPRQVELRDLPTDPASVPLPEGYPNEDWVEALEAGSCAGTPASTPCPPRSGIAISEARAWRDAQYRIGYQELRRNYEADRQVWVAQRDLYEAQIQADAQEIERLQPSWWSLHRGEILATVGVIAGTALAIGVMAVVVEVDEP